MSNSGNIAFMSASEQLKNLRYHVATVQGLALGRLDSEASGATLRLSPVVRMALRAKEAFKQARLSHDRREAKQRRQRRGRNKRLAKGRQGKVRVFTGFVYPAPKNYKRQGRKLCGFTGFGVGSVYRAPKHRY
jgi:hypothetical protein